MLCKLCRSAEAIRESHIVPKFIGEWIKAQSSTGGLRDPNHPNVRRQDTTKFPLLCVECEERFSSREDEFARHVFYPFSQDGQHEFDYCGWLLYFAVSLSWRIAVMRGDDPKDRNPEMTACLEAASSTWRVFLLEKSADVHHYTYHLFFDSVAHCIEHVGTFYDGRYALRSIDGFVPSTLHDIGVYVKIPGMTFFSCVHPESPAGWANTRILEDGRIGDSGQEVVHELFWQAMHDSAKRVAEGMNSMSQVQKDKLRKRVSRL
jgi:hypothetical protein